MADRVLVVEDDKDMREMLTYVIKGEGFDVIPAANGRSALRVIETGGADLALLDRMLPDMDGIQVCEEARKKSEIPIIFVSALTTENDKVASLNVGADDYVDKPFKPGELAARIRAHLRRSQTRDGEVAGQPMCLGDLQLDPSCLSLTIGSTPIHVTRLEFKLLHALARAEGKVVSRAALLQCVWGDSRYVDPAGLNVYIRRLRIKIEVNPSRPQRLLTLRTVGFKLVAPNGSAPTATSAPGRPARSLPATR